MYDQIAQVYDLLHTAVKDDIPFVLEMADQAGGPILELGSGTGRLLIPLAREGYWVVGVDNSAAMIDQARRNIAREAKHVQARISLVRADLRTFRSEVQFPLVLIGYNTLMHFSPGQVSLFLPELKKMVMSDGRLFMDLANPYEMHNLDDDNPAIEQIFRDDKGHVALKMVYSSAPGSDQMSRRIKWEALWAEFNDRDSRLIFEGELRYYYPHEIDLILANGGFRTEAICGDYDRAPFNEDSERLIVLARIAA